MIEVKFRGKRLDNGKWITGSHTLIQDADGTWLEDENLDVVKVDPDTLGQYTGLKDKNGKEIYVRDILGIYYDDGDSGITTVRNFGEIDYYTDDSDYTILAWFDLNKCEIIGNIHDNPELLKGGQR